MTLTKLCHLGDADVTLYNNPKKKNFVRRDENHALNRSAKAPMLGTIVEYPSSTRTVLNDFSSCLPLCT
jgi:hypothetical protein